MMIPRRFQIIFVAILLTVLVTPVSIARSQSILSSTGATTARSYPTPVITAIAETSGRAYLSSMDYEFPDPPERRERDSCQSISRFCEWLAHYDAIAEPEDETTDATDLVVPEQSGDEDKSSTDENRSVVGWSSATIDSLERQQKLAPVQLDVPSLSISAAVSGVGVNEDRSMQVPNDFNTVGWYRHGPAPGEAGSAAIAGHLDDVNGKSVFYDLQYIEDGAEITVSMENGDTRSFRVFDKQAYDSTNLPAEDVFTREGDPVLSLITCGGDWDSSAGRYTQTVVVYAEPI